jgi:hypothetical protein
MEDCFRRRLQIAGVRGKFLRLFRIFRQASEKLFKNRHCDMVTQQHVQPPADSGFERQTPCWFELPLSR